MCVVCKLLKADGTIDVLACISIMCIRPKSGSYKKSSCNIRATISSCPKLFVDYIVIHLLILRTSVFSPTSGQVNF